MKRWTQEETEFLIKNYSVEGIAYCAKTLNRSEKSIRQKASRLSVKIVDTGKSQRLKAFTQYLERLKTSDYECLETFKAYKGNATKLSHRHKSCGYIWKVSPNNITKLVGCPSCSRKGYKEHRETFLYLVYFPILDLFKIGVTVDWERRKYDFGYTPELIHIERFETGKEAYYEEKKLLKVLEPYLYNSEELRNGNSETFLWPS